MNTASAANPVFDKTAREILDAVSDVCGRHDITSLEDFAQSCRTFAQEETLSIAVLGRFKAGKSSFLNQLIGRPLLPVGVIPVTTVITEIQYGPCERAEVRSLDGSSRDVPVADIGEFISEERNPNNAKQVNLVHVELPSMEPYRGIRFVDTPGLESVFEHNTTTSLEWLPNVGLALVAVGVDPPLSQRDVELIQGLSRYTPNIALLLTKVDLVEEDERRQVVTFVEAQLARFSQRTLPVFPYSTRPGFESLQANLRENLMSHTERGLEAERTAILRHKLDSLIGECADYLNVALRSAEAADSERDDLRRKILGEKEVLEDARLAPRLIVRHAAGAVRPAFEAFLKNDEQPMRARLLAELNHEFDGWARNLSAVTQKFDEWLQHRLVEEVSETSVVHRTEFIEPIRRASRQLSQSAQDFRNRMSERAMETLGVPLRTTEMELRTNDPTSPDIRVGKIFDHNWELLSFLVPMVLAKGTVKKHFARKVEYIVFMNLSRLVSQWEEIVRAELTRLEKEAIRRLDTLVSTIERLVTAASAQAPSIREDLRRLQELRYPPAN